MANQRPLFAEHEPPVAPAVWPSPGTRAYEALQALLTGPQNQADYPYGWRLAANVKELEYSGWVFLKRDIHRAGCRRPITEYQLDYQAPAVSAALAARKQGGSNDRPRSEVPHADVRRRVRHRGSPPARR